MTIARVFPRKTSATPDDPYAFIGDVPKDIERIEDITEVHISVTFTWDLEEATRLAEEWTKIAPVKIGGPATGMRGEKFEIGKYLKKGCLITSRGCPNHCWFCSVPKREGPLRELDVQKGNKIFDDNLLACSKEHIIKVFDMLKTQPDVRFSGGLEAKLLQAWHVEQLARVKTQQVFFAYDTPDDLPPLIRASELLQASEWYRWRKCGCYILIGYPSDTIQKAEERCMKALRLGYAPFAMFYRDASGIMNKTKEWAKFQRLWTRQAIIATTRKTMGMK